MCRIPELVTSKRKGVHTIAAHPSPSAVCRGRVSYLPHLISLCLLFFGGTENWTQNLTLPRQALCYWAVSLAHKQPFSKYWPEIFCVSCLRKTVIIPDPQGCLKKQWDVCSSINNFKEGAHSAPWRTQIIPGDAGRRWCRSGKAVFPAEFLLFSIQAFN